MKTKLILFLAVAFLACGCQYRTFTAPGGAKYTSLGLGTSSQLNGLDVKHDPTTGSFDLKVKSASTDNTAVAAEALALAAKALAPK